MLQIVFLALVIGIALTLIPDEKARPVMRVCEGMTEVILALVRVVMQVAPFAVFTLLVEVMASMGLDVLGCAAGLQRRRRARSRDHGLSRLPNDPADGVGYPAAKISGRYRSGATSGFLQFPAPRRPFR